MAKYLTLDSTIKIAKSTITMSTTDLVMTIFSFSSINEKKKDKTAEDRKESFDLISVVGVDFMG